MVKRKSNKRFKPITPNRRLLLNSSRLSDTFVTSRETEKKVTTKPIIYDMAKTAPIIILHIATLKSELKDYLDNNRYMTRCIFSFGIMLPTLLTLVTATFASTFWQAFFAVIFVVTLGSTIYYGYLWSRKKSDVDKLISTLKRKSIKQ
jgi:hypothetical protein